MNKPTAQLGAAVRAHRSGRLQDAARLYRTVLRRNPRDADALHLLGVVLAEAGHLDEAAACVVEAIAIRGPAAPYCANLGRVLVRQQRHSQAAACFRQALVDEPLDAGVTFQLALALIAQGNRSEARVALEQAVALEPGFAEGYFCLGSLAMMERNVNEALRWYRNAVRVQPAYPEARNNLGLLFHAQSSWNEAEQQYLAVLRHCPEHLDAQYNLARLREDMGHPEVALAAYTDILSRTPDHVPSQTNLGNCLIKLARPEEAIGFFQRALARNPEYAEAHWNLSLALLATGRFDEGWREYEWRFRQFPELCRGFQSPRWDGGALQGRRILVHSEQGMGDTIQFVRFTSLVKQLDAHVILECQPPLGRLLAGLRPVDDVVARGSELPPFDCHAPLLSLPAILGVGAETFADPYLYPDPALVEHWGRRIANASGTPAVGLAWAGNARHPNDRNRSIPAELLSELDGAPVRWLNLQTGPAAAAIPDRPTIEPLAGEFEDFADTAAAIHHLDLIVTVDTAVAHLAGAFGRPVWTLLPFAADWRWRDQGSDTPWYPSMRLFRQTSPGDWRGVLERVKMELAALRR